MNVKLLAFLFILAAPSAWAQDEMPLTVPFSVPGVTYNDAIPTPQEVLGHRIGERHTRPHEIVEYLKAIAEASDRVTMGEYARTYEGRPLVYAVVTSPENHARLDEIRQANLQLSDAPETVSDADVQDQAGVVNLHYSVHGNEASGAEAGLLTLYHLAAGEGEPVQDVLDNLVVVLDPLINPDGRDRFVDWANSNRGGVPTTDGQDREHNEPWPGGRTNHYWFDLNRDWLPLQHPESRGRLELFHHWRPQVLIDAHEMGSNATFFFQPGIPSRNNPNTPDATFDLTEELATYHAKVLDRIGSLYYSKESFDDFYYGKGSTYPDVNGAVGVLFEQASSRALERDASDGVLTYGFTIRNQVAASMSTLEGAVAMREDLLRHQRDFYAAAPDLAAENPVKAYVLGLNGDRTRAQALAQMLKRHRIQIHTLAESVTLDGESFEAGEAYIVPMDQSQYRLIKAAMERVTTFEDSLFYDVSAWTMPLAFGVSHAEVRRDPTNLIGAEVETVEFDGGRVVGGEAPYAYLMEWGRYFAPRALYKLIDAGITPRLAREPFESEIDGETVRFDRGTIVIPVTQRDARSRVTADDVHQLVQQLADEDHVVIHAVETGLTPSGNDLGGTTMPVLDLPRIALVAGSGTGSYQVGETWHLLSERFGIPVSLVDLDDLGSIELSAYNVLVMARGYAYNQLNGGVDRLKDWVRRGGSLIAMENAVQWVVEQDFVDEQMKADTTDTPNVSYAEVGRTMGAQFIGGTIFEAELDTTHPLAFGLDDTIALFRTHTLFLEPSETAGVSVATYTEDPLLSGYVSAPRLDQIRESAAVVAHSVGGGSVILIMDNPNFRAFWYGSNPLFLNAVSFGRAF